MGALRAVGRCRGLQTGAPQGIGCLFTFDKADRALGLLPLSQLVKRQATWWIALNPAALHRVDGTKRLVRFPCLIDAG